MMTPKPLARAPLANSAAESISTVYQREGSWDGTVLAEAKSTSAMSSDVGIQVIGPDGQVLYDDTWEHTRESAGHAGPVSNAPTGADSAVTAPIFGANDSQVGTLRLWAFGSETLLTRADAAFRSNSYGAIAVAAAIAVVLACVIGYFTSKRLSTPIQRITNTARQLRNGDLTARSGVRGSDEIGQLGETFDDMATSLERDLKLEHRLTGDVAHELRTPLMAMQATVEAMQDGVLPADDEHFSPGGRHAQAVPPGERLHRAQDRAHRRGLPHPQPGDLTAPALPREGSPPALC